MSTYDLDEMIKRWAQDKLTTEQAVGQILLYLQGVVQRLGKIERFAEAQRTVEKPKPVVKKIKKVKKGKGKSKK